MRIPRTCLFLAVISLSNITFAGEIIEFPRHRVPERSADQIPAEHLLIDFNERTRKVENCKMALSGSRPWSPPHNRFYVRHDDEVQKELLALRATLSSNQSMLLSHLMDSFHLGPYDARVVTDVQELHSSLSEAQRPLLEKLLKSMYPAL